MKVGFTRDRWACTFLMTEDDVADMESIYDLPDDLAQRVINAEKEYLESQKALESYIRENDCFVCAIDVDTIVASCTE